MNTMKFKNALIVFLAVTTVAARADDLQSIIAKRVMEIDQKQTQIKEQKKAIENLRAELRKLDYDRGEHIENTVLVAGFTALMVASTVILFKKSYKAYRRDAEFAMEGYLRLGLIPGFLGVVGGFGTLSQFGELYADRKKRKELEFRIDELLHQIANYEKELADDMLILKQAQAASGSGQAERQ